MEGTDVCFAPVLTMAEAPQHPHNGGAQNFCRAVTALPSPRPRHAFLARRQPFASPPPRISLK